MGRKWKSIVQKRNITHFLRQDRWLPSLLIMLMKHEQAWKWQGLSSLAPFSGQARQVGIISGHQMELCLRFWAEPVMTNEDLVEKERICDESSICPSTGTSESTTTRRSGHEVARSLAAACSCVVDRASYAVYWPLHRRYTWLLCIPPSYLY